MAMNDPRAVAALTVTGLAAGYCLGYLWEETTRDVGHLAHIGGYHFHHSLFGPLCLLVLPFVQGTAGVVLVPALGAGFVLHHGVSDRFVFITPSELE